jgi:small subunit ribosomal protein S8
MVNYAVSDMITRIRNGIRVRKTKVSVPETKLTRSIATILKREGFILEIQENDASNGAKLPTFDVFLKYKTGKGGANPFNATQPQSVLTNMKCVSRPGVRIYANSTQIPQVLGGLGVTILSTSKGILTDYEARTLGVGGEILCMLW